MLLFLVCGIVASEVGNFALGTAIFASGLTALDWFFKVPVWDSIVANPLLLVFYLLVYTAVGSVFTLLWLWPEYLRDNSQAIRDSYARYLKGKDRNDPDTFFASDYYGFKVVKHKQQIATWILTWPFSLVWELARKPIKYAYQFIYTMLGDAFEVIGQRISSRIINKR